MSNKLAPVFKQISLSRIKHFVEMAEFFNQFAEIFETQFPGTVHKLEFNLQDKVLSYAADSKFYDSIVLLANIGEKYIKVEFNSYFKQVDVTVSTYESILSKRTFHLDPGRHTPLWLFNTIKEFN